MNNGKNIPCWESVRCGKEKQCPAFPDQGRICFSVKGTLCRGELQGGFGSKIEKCKTVCSFYKELGEEY